MAGIKWIIFAFCVALVGAQFGFNPNRPNRPLQLTSPRKAPPVSPKFPLLRALKDTLADNKCFTLARRPYHMVRVMRYPCNKGINGVPVMRSFMGRMGPICQSYLRVPVIRYFKIETCCPGWAADASGKCTIRKQKNFLPLPKDRRPNLLPTMALASNLRMAMLQKAKDAMARKRAMMAAANMARMVRMRDSPKVMRPPMSPLPFIINKIKSKLMAKPGTKVTFLRFPKPLIPPVPRPVPRPPMKLHMIKIIRTKPVSTLFTQRNRMMPPPRNPMLPPRNIPMIFPPRMPMMNPRRMPTMSPPRMPMMSPPRMPMMSPPRMPMMSPPRMPRIFPPRMPMMRRPFPMMPRPPRPFRSFPMIPRPVPTMVMSNRMPSMGFRPMPKMHFNEPRIPQIPDAPQAEPTSPAQIPPDYPAHKPFPQIPVSHDQENMENPPVVHFRSPLPQMREGILPEEEQQMMQVDLPHNPVQMPDLIVEEGPMNSGNFEDEPQSCIRVLESAVKSCLKQNKIDVPDVMTAFEPFNDDTSRVLCEKEKTIFECVNTALKECANSPDEATARGMLQETTTTVRDMCEMREISVATDPVVEEPVVDSNSTLEGAESNMDTNVNFLDTEAPIDVVEEVPKTAVASAKEEVIKDAAAMQEAIKHEVHVQEVEMREYYLPIVIGSGVGFIILVLTLSLVICCCCKRKLKRKLKMAKEAEKPPLQGIYTIGVPPPIYEVKGIPPVYYEEAKGEKITSGSPSVLEGSDISGEVVAERDEHTPM